MRCPFCLCDDLRQYDNENCCDQCGASFQVIADPEPTLLDSAKERGLAEINQK